MLADRLDRAGGEGLYELTEAAGARAEHAREGLEHLERRARAAGLLYSAFTEARDEARNRYQAPLRNRIESLGRPLFGEDFRIVLDDDLGIVERAAGGDTLPYALLSTGAREQLSLLTRVAAAELVSATEGAPLILDDVLGYSDPDRLRVLGGILARAGAALQILILTSFPDRYRHLDGAHIVHLG